MRRDSVAERRFIEIGPEFKNDVVVERGLAPGEMIVTEGYHKLTPGVKVQVAHESMSQEENKSDNDSSTTAPEDISQEENKADNDSSTTSK